MSAAVVDLKGGKYKVAKEVAESEFVRLCEANRIDHDTSEMSEKEKEDWADLRNEIVRDIRLGTVVVGEDGKPTYTPPIGGAKSYTFHPATGATFMALETYSTGKNISNLTAALAEMTRTDKGEFGKMPAKDFHACRRLAQLFLSDR